MEQAISIIENKLRDLVRHTIYTDEYAYVVIQDNKEKLQFVLDCENCISKVICTDKITLSLFVEDEVGNPILRAGNPVIGANNSLYNKDCDTDTLPAINNYNLNDIVLIVGKKENIELDDIETHFLINKDTWEDVFISYLLIKGNFPSKQIGVDLNNYFYL